MRSLQERLRALEASVRGNVQAGETAQETAAAYAAEAPIVPLREDAGARQATATPGPGTLEANGFTFDRTSGTWHRAFRTDILSYHGPIRFADVFTCDTHQLGRAAKIDIADFQDLRFYDTETTGLGSGAGTIPFLHAIGRFEEDEFVVHQYFLADYSAEGALLQRILEEHFVPRNDLSGRDDDALAMPATSATIVSFNGKSFDWPLLRNRLTMHRLTEPAVNHLDLLYPSRRLWRQRIGRVSLGHVETEILGLERLNDVPGREAPDRYFGFVDNGDADPLIPVFDHNATDVCSLVTLMTVLCDILAGRQAPEAASEWTALARLYDEWQESDLAVHCFARATECPDASWREHWLRSLHHKRRGEWEEAHRLWITMADRWPWSVPPCVELAKLLEHRLRRYDDALRWAREAKRRARQAPQEPAGGQVGGQVAQGTGMAQGTGGTWGQTADLVALLEHRIARVERKLTRSARG